MRKFTLLSILGFLVQNTSSFATHTQDILIKNANIQTLDQSSPVAHWMVIRSGRILKMGISDVNQGLPVGPFAAEYDFKGRTVLPSFHDNHIHPIDSGVEFEECRIYDADTKTKLLEMIKKCDESLPHTKKWLRGSGWSSYALKEIPHKKWLDDLSLNHPVALMSADGHSYWLDSKGLALVGVTQTTEAPYKGVIGKDQQGQLTGVLYETAMDLVEEVLPSRTLSQLERGLKLALHLMRENGITSFKDASVEDEKHLQVYESLDQKGQLLADVFLSLYADPKDAQDGGTKIIAKFLDWKKRYSTNNIHIQTVKIFLDGVIEDKTGALLTAGTKIDDIENVQWKTNILNPFVIDLDRSGFQVHFHAIGDAAVKMALNAIETAQNKNGNQGHRHEIAHLQLIEKSDVARFKALDISAVFPPFWALHDEAVDKSNEVIGDDRIDRQYVMGEMLNTRGRMAFGSDWAVTSMNVFEGIETAMTRKDPGSEEDAPAWQPEQRIPLLSALQGYTINGAIATFQENVSGSLSVGKYANFIVVDQNPFEIHTNKIGNTKVLETFRRGKRIWSN